MSNEFVVVETIEDNVIVHETFDDVDSAESAVRNVKRRVNVQGDVFVATMFEEEECVEIESDYIDPNSFISFSNAAIMLGVRYQQVFQRAVTKNKMVWRQVPENQVLLQDVLEWKQKRMSR